MRHYSIGPRHLCVELHCKREVGHSAEQRWSTQMLRAQNAQKDCFQQSLLRAGRMLQLS